MAALTPAYVVNSDFENYVEGWETTDSAALTRLLARAERYIDMIGAARPIKGADAVQSIGITGGIAVSGQFKIQWTIWESTFTSGPIPYNASYAQMLVALSQLLTINNTQTLPGSAIMQVQQQSLVEPPLPSPLTFGFIGALGSQPIPVGTLVAGSNTMLDISNNPTPVPVVTVICPGDFMGHRFNPSELLWYGQLQSVKNAVCAQAEFMLQMGENYFIEPQYVSVAGPDFTTVGRRPVISPKALRELAVGGLVRNTMARARP
jgi:hypothetical protein